MDAAEREACIGNHVSKTRVLQQACAWTEGTAPAHEHAQAATTSHRQPHRLPF